MTERLLEDETRLEQEIEAFRRDVARLEEEIARAVLGQEATVREVLIALLAGGHALLEGVPGVGKTLLVRTVAAVSGLDVARIQCTPDLIPADVTGTNILLEAEDRSRHLRFQPGPIFAQVVLADEINRATPKTQSAFLEAMEERQVTVAGTTYPLPRPFMLLATQNPIEMEGTFPLPEAQVDRFLFKVLVPYPTAEDMLRIATETTGRHEAHARSVLSPERVLAMQQLVRSVPVPAGAASAAVRAVRSTHPDDPGAIEAVRRLVRFGGSPRAVQAMVLGAKVHALLAGRCHVALKDLASVLRPALRHRLILNFEASAEGVHADALLAQVAESFLE